MSALHLPTLLAVGVLLMVLATAATALAAQTQRTYRGHGTWVAAQGLATLGLALQWVAEGRGVTWIAGQMLLAQWPITIVVGLRRFHARHPLQGSLHTDVAALAAALAATLLAVGSSEAACAATLAAVAVALHTYAAWTMLPACRSTHSAAAGLWLAAFGATAAAEVLALKLLEPATLVAAAGLIAVPMAPAAAYLVLLQQHERTERELRQSRRRLRVLANTDMLTRVPNRRHFTELAQRVIQHVGQRSAALLLFDIDHFKLINDRLGHAAGDMALRIVSECMQETLRARDVAGRHGGDEFVLLLPATSIGDAMTVASRIVERAQEIAAANKISGLSLSFGVVSIQEGESLDEAMRRADQALYEAKRQGRGRAVCAVGEEDNPVFVESRRLGLTPS